MRYHSSRPVVIWAVTSTTIILSLLSLVIVVQSFVTTTTTTTTKSSFFTTTAAATPTTSTSSTSSSSFPFPSNSFSLSPPTTSISTTCINMAASTTSTTDVIDPYIWLEDVESQESLDFARAANEECLKKLGNPEQEQGSSSSYERILKVLESDDRIPYVTKYGNTINEQGDDAILYNFWKDANNRRGIWRKTTMSLYKSSSQEQWTTVLDIDVLGKKDDIPWVYGGNTPLPRSRDETQHGIPKNQQQVSRTLVMLSRGGSDAKHVREFDLQAMDFVSNMDSDEVAFDLPEAKTRCSYKSRNVLLVGTDFGPDSLTDSGYPRTVREWVRGTPLEDAPIVFEGEKQDVSVSHYISDERTWNGNIYEIQTRALTFYTSKYWIRKIKSQHLLAMNNPQREAIPPPPDFIPLDIQDDASASLLGNLILISLRSDWQPKSASSGGNGPTYKKGSVIYTNTDKFLAGGAAACDFLVLFTPTERTAYEYWTATKNFLILATMDNVKSKLEFFKIHSSKDDDSGGGGGTTTLTPIGGGGGEDGSSTSTIRIRDCKCNPMDPYEGSDLFWFTKSDYITPEELYLADASLVEKHNDDDSNNAHHNENGDNDIFIIDKLKSLPPQFDSDNLIVEQRSAISKDGTEIPYFIVMHKNVVLNGKNPTLLYGYGGFEVSLGPHYIAVTGLAWLERGGVYVEANTRGGGEFGPAWHQAALLDKRHKAYEDFAAVGEHLIESKICKPKTLAIRGGSNGGLLVANLYVMRPDLFGAVHCAVPLLDMQRYHTLLAGASWMAEYGNPDTDDWEKFLHKYSPYHNIQPGTKYPPILVTTSTRDDRVHPGHARKFVKKLCDSNVENVYYYENIEGGHGGAADAKQSAFMTALAYDFMFHTLENNAKDME